MAWEDINDWIGAKRGRQREVADALGIEQDKVSKSTKGIRQWRAAEVDVIRRLMNDDQGLTAGAVRFIPLLGSVPAGSFREAIRNPKGHIPVPDASVPSNAFALDPEGDSMDLVVPDGSRIILDPDDLDLYPGRFYLVQNQYGDTTFKKYEADPARLVPCSSNPAHQEIMIGREPFDVRARVIGSFTRF